MYYIFIYSFTLFIYSRQKVALTQNIIQRFKNASREQSTNENKKNKKDVYAKKKIKKKETKTVMQLTNIIQVKLYEGVRKNLQEN